LENIANRLLLDEGTFEVNLGEPSFDPEEVKAFIDLSNTSFDELNKHKELHEV
jgi:hypothetical protein